MKSFAFTMYVALVIIMVGVLSVIFINNHVAPYDDSDPPNGRSGMDVLTDHLTGCQYLYRRGAITPRMDRDGKQICITTGIQQ